MSVQRNGSDKVGDKRPKELADPIRSPHPMILTFHEIADQRSSSLYSLSTEQFEKHLQIIQELRTESGLKTPSIQVTFDDGHVSNYQLAMPLLERYRIRATFFVTVGLTGVSAHHMSWSQLEELLAAGHEVQSHTWSHPFLTECSQPVLEDELLHSREVLGEKLALPVGKIAIPYGRYSLRILRACAAAGYQQVYTSSPWTGSRSHCGVCVCGRFSVRSTLDPAELKRLLTLRALPYLYRQSKSHGKEAVKMLLGDRFYTSVWVGRIRSIFDLTGGLSAK